MSMELLRQIAEQRLPYTIYAPALIDELRVLRAAGLVTAFVPPVEQMQCGAQSHKPAQVLAITPKGRKALQGEPEDEPIVLRAGRPT